MKKMPKNAEKYSCDICNFICCKKSNYVIHTNTSKHKNRTNLEQENAEKMPLHECKNCKKKYKARNSLWYHEKNCSHIYNDSEILIQSINQMEPINQLELINKTEPNQLETLTKLISVMVEQNGDLQKQIIDICKNGTNNTLINNNSNNKTFNLNVFLNETCKDAMNIMDFVDSLKLQLSDLESVGKLGFVEGISNIIVKNLKAMDVHLRPVHCGDLKREVMYIKDENKWEKENQENGKLRKVIKKIAHKNSKLIPQFKEKHPDCGKSISKYSDQFNKLVIEAMGGQGDNDSEKEDKIIRNIAKVVVIDKSL